MSLELSRKIDADLATKARQTMTGDFESRTEVLKSDPDNAVALRQQYTDISPGYHMNKKHWITLEGCGPIDETLVEQLVTDSYHLVAGRRSQADRPMNPRAHPHQP